MAKLLIWLAAAVLAPRASADMVIFRGKVVLEDGSPPGRPVTIQRMCDGFGGAEREGSASPKTGDYFVRLYAEPFGSGFFGGWRSGDMLSCYLEAAAPGFTSTRLDLGDRRISSNPQLPKIVLSRRVPGALMDFDHAPTVSQTAKRPWEMALKRLSARDWTGAELALRAVVAAAPNFAPAWAALGGACQNLQKLAEARRALERALELDPKRLPLYQGLARVEIGLKDWAAAAATSEALIHADTDHTFLEAYLDSGIARYQQHDYDGALQRIHELIQLDKRHELPRSEYVLGVILEAKGDLHAAAAHLQQYLDQYPRAGDAGAVRERLANLGKQPPAELSAEPASAQGRLSAVGEAPVPGGLKAFAAIAQMRETPTYQDFFLQYCRAIIGSGLDRPNATREVTTAVRAFIFSVTELDQLGDHDGNRTVIRLSVSTDEQRKKTARALALLGWRLSESGQGYDLELGDQAIDSLRQRIPGALGIDELKMREDIVAGRPFQFEIPTENARLLGGAAWSAALKRSPGPARGPVDIFLSDWRFARAYSGLGAMEAETAAAAASAVGLVPLITKYSDLVAQYGPALSLAGDRVAVPGGVEAEPVWSRLAGVSPRNPPAFFRALLEKDRGLLLTFFFDLSRADAAHQQFITATADRAEAFYQWYRDSAGQGPPAPNSARWQATILQKLRLGAGGSVQFPGGRKAWTADAATDEEALLHLPSCEPLAAVLALEDKRARPLDEGSVSLLARHYDEWRHLFPYFEKLPGLAEKEFRALEAFADSVSAALPAQQAVLVGDWHSLVELIVLGIDAGSLNAAQAVNAFGKVCEALRSANPSAKVIGILREIAVGSADVDEAVVTRLLRLSGARRDAFERVKILQRVPLIASLGAAPDPRKTLAALSGAAYAALLAPDFLLVAEDPLLLAKHDFLPRSGNQTRLFAPAALAISNDPPGSHLTGGFAKFGEVTAALDWRRVGAEPSPEGEDSDAAAGESVGPIASPDAPVPFRATGETIFQANGRIVEVYATVTNSRGRYVDDLDRNDFTVQVEGQPTRLFAFENHTANVSVALLFDTTGSMDATLPSLKRAAMLLIDDLRPGDFAAVYGFNERVTEFQPFTAEKSALKRGVLRAHPAGGTALYDALVTVSRDLAQRQGKKVIIVFTDGDDNASVLTAEAAILRAKSAGIPIYTIAQGEALQHPKLVRRLADLSQATAGAPFQIRKLEDIGAAFGKMSEDLKHGYLLALQPPPAAVKAWRGITVAIPNRKGLVVRAREGYYSE